MKEKTILAQNIQTLRKEKGVDTGADVERNRHQYASYP